MCVCARTHTHTLTLCIEGIKRVMAMSRKGRLEQQEEAAAAAAVKETLQEEIKKAESLKEVQKRMEEGHVAVDIGGGLCVVGAMEVVDGVVGAKACTKSETECGEGSMCGLSHEHKAYYRAKTAEWKATHASKCLELGLENGRGGLVSNPNFSLGIPSPIPGGGQG